MQEYIVASLPELDKLCENLSQLFSSTNILLLEGEMGSGKTTFVKSLLKHLECKDEVNSPTYAIVNEYQTKEFVVYHFDLHRLKDEEELLNIGFEEYLNKGICIIEWPQIAESFIDEYIRIKLFKIDENTRKICIFK